MHEVVNHPGAPETFRLQVLGLWLRPGHRRRVLAMSSMERIPLGGAELEYTVEGAGEPVLLVHAGVIADFFAPLTEELLRTGRFQVVSYHRIGYGESSRPGSAGLAEQAGHCHALLQHAGIDRAHVVGHSSGGLIAARFALDAPEVVSSLALLEPVNLDVPSGQELVQGAVGTAFQRFATGDKEGAVDAFMRGVCGPDYRSVLDRALGPRAFQQAVADADSFFGVEAPSAMQWHWDQVDATRLALPLLSVVGGESDSVSRVSTEGHAALLRLFPQAEAYVLPNANHLLQLQNAKDLAAALTDFFDRHPLSHSQ